MPGLPAELDGLTILHLTDFHAGTPSLNVRAMRKAVEVGVRWQPDLVALTGDILSHGRARAAVVAAMEGLRPPLGIFAVLGNHDVGDTHDPFSRGVVIDDWGGAPVTMLRDRSAVVEWRGREIELAGVDPRLFAEGRNRPPEQLFTRPGALRVLLSHFPDVPAEMPPGTCSLALCGHLHGGQICLPGPVRQGAAVAPLVSLRRGRLRGARDDRGGLARARHDTRAVPALRPARGEPAAPAAALAATEVGLERQDAVVGGGQVGAAALPTSPPPAGWCRRPRLSPASR